MYQLELLFRTGEIHLRMDLNFLNHILIYSKSDA